MQKCNHSQKQILLQLLQQSHFWKTSHVQPLAVQGKLSRLGKEARAAGRDPKGSTKRPAASPDASQAASEPDSDSNDDDDDKSFQEEVEGAGGRRTRQASAQRESGWQDMEATPPKQKSRRKVSSTLVTTH